MFSLFFSAFIKREAVAWWMKAAKLGCWRVQELEQQPTATTAVNQGIWMLYGTVTVHSLSMFRSLESLFQLDRWVMTATTREGPRRRFKDDQGPVAGTQLLHAPYPAHLSDRWWYKYSLFSNFYFVPIKRIIWAGKYRAWSVRWFAPYGYVAMGQHSTHVGTTMS